MCKAQIEYREIMGFPGCRVGSEGSIWSAWKKIVLPRQGSKVFVGSEWHQRTASLESRTGYLCVRLYRGGRGFNFRVHTLVLRTFVGPKPTGMVACHNNGIARDCRVLNLRWDTPAHNSQDRIAHGTVNCGSRNGASKLTETDVRQMRGLRRSGSSTRSLAHKFGVSYQHACAIINRTAWGWLSDV